MRHWDTTVRVTLNHAITSASRQDIPRKGRQKWPEKYHSPQ